MINLIQKYSYDNWGKEAYIDKDGAIIGVGAFLLANSYVGKRIEIPDFRLVPSDAVILNQKQADDLHPVSVELEKLRKEIVQHNMRHCQQYLSKRYWY